MPRVVRKWRGTVRALLNDALDDITSLVDRSNKFKAKNEAAAIFTDADLATIALAETVLEDVLAQVKTR